MGSRNIEYNLGSRLAIAEKYIYVGIIDTYTPCRRLIRNGSLPQVAPLPALGLIRARVIFRAKVMSKFLRLDTAVQLEI